MDTQIARRHLVDSQIRPNDVTDISIQTAFLTVPREVFLPSGLKEHAYVEREIGYQPGRALICARDLSKLLAAADVRSTHLVLDVAIGSGYSTALLAHMADMVVAVERDDQAVACVEETLTGQGIVNAAVVAADPVAGVPKQGPYDRIFLSTAVEVVPDSLLSQLKDGGKLSAIVCHEGMARGIVFSRAGETFCQRVVFDASARIIAEGFEKVEKFSF